MVRIYNTESSDLSSVVRMHKEKLGLKCSKINGWPTACQCGQLDGLWRLSISLTERGTLTCSIQKALLAEALEEKCVSNVQARLSADGRGMHCAVLSFLTITLPRG